MARSSGAIKQIDLRTDLNLKKSFSLNTALDKKETEISAEEAKISASSLMQTPTQEQSPVDTSEVYKQGYAQALTSLTPELKSARERENAAGGLPGAAAAGVGAVAAGGVLGAGGFAALSGTTGASQGEKPTSVPYSPFKGSTGRPVITSGYGRRNGRMHKGYDVEADPGTPVYAYFPGVVVENNYDPNGWGNYVKWKDNVYGQTHLYGHLQSRSPIPVGQKFDQGALLGRVGSTGRSTGPHLHWEIGNGNTNPAEWVRTNPMKTKESEVAKIKPASTSKTQTAAALKPSTTSSTSTQTLIQPIITQTPAKVASQPGSYINGGSNTSSNTSKAVSLASYS